MDRTRTLSRISFGVTVGATSAAVVLHSVAFYTSFDREVGYFDASLLPLLCRLLTTLASVGPAIFALLLPASALPRRTRAGRRDPIAALPLLAFLLFFILLLITDHGLSSKMRLLLGLLSLGSAAYFACTLTGRGRASDGVALIGCLPVFWCFAAVAQTYGEWHIAMNSPLKISIQFGFLSAMLAMCAELRYRMNHPAPRVRLVVQSLAVFFCLDGAVPLLIAACDGMVEQKIYLLYAAVLIGLGLYFAERLFRLLFLPAVEDAAPAVPDATDISDVADVPDVPNAEATPVASDPSPAPSEASDTTED